MASTKKAAPAAKKAPVKAAKKAPATKVAKKQGKVAMPAWKPRKGEVLEYTRRNGETGSGKYKETVDYGRGPWYILSVEGMRKPTASVRPSEARRPEPAKAAA